MAVQRTLAALVRTPPAIVVLTAAFAYGAGYAARYLWIEPEAFGTLCRAADVPAWCTVRSALIRVTEVGGLGYASVALALAGYLVRGRAACMLGLAAALLAGAGLVLYNTTFAALGILIAVLHAARMSVPAKITPPTDRPIRT